MTDVQYPAQMDGFRLPPADTVNTPFSMQAAAAADVEPKPEETEQPPAPKPTPEQPAEPVAAPAEQEK